MFQTTDPHLQQLKQLLHEVLPSLSRKTGYAECSLADVDRYAPDVLTAAWFVTSTTYLMARNTSNNFQFVHFTTKNNASSMIHTGLKPSDSLDYTDSFCCFRCDCLAIPFIPIGADTAVVFEYTGDYLTCIRQEDSMSNIGYSIIENPSSTPGAPISNACITHILSIEHFMHDNEAHYFPLDQLLVHHGIPSAYVQYLDNWRVNDTELSRQVAYLHGCVAVGQDPSQDPRDFKRTSSFGT